MASNSKGYAFVELDEEDLSAKLRSGYMTERTRKVIILTKNKLKIENVILELRP